MPSPIPGASIDRVGTRERRMGREDEQGKRADQEQPNQPAEKGSLGRKLAARCKRVPVDARQSQR